MNCVSCDICVYHLRFGCVFLRGVFLSSRVTGACPVTTDLIMRVNNIQQQQLRWRTVIILFLCSYTLVSTDSFSAVRPHGSIELENIYILKKY